MDSGRTIFKAGQALGQHVRPRAWEGARAFIVGGGPSLRGFDFGLLKNELTIGINKAFEFFDPTIIFSMDVRFWQWVEEGTLGDDLRDKFLNYTHGLKVLLRCQPDAIFTEDILTLEHAGARAFTKHFNHGVGSGNNSGMAALNLAVALGANPIYLLGFDMHGGSNGKQEWFHGGYPIVQKDSVYHEFRTNITEVAAPACAEAGVEVINLSPGSALTCFPIAPRESFPRKSIPTVVSYYTTGTPYEDEVKNLQRSLRAFGLPSAIIGVPSRGSWTANTQIKPEVMLKVMDAIDGPILWVDADAMFLGYPSLLVDLDAMCDVAVHYRQGHELLAGTIYMANNERSRSLLVAWIEACHNDPGTMDQVILEDVIRTSEAKVFNLPPTYTAIFDLMPEAGEFPIIEHYQASRRFKNLMGVLPDAVL